MWEKCRVTKQDICSVTKADNSLMNCAMSWIIWTHGAIRICITAQHLKFVINRCCSCVFLWWCDLTGSMHAEQGLPRYKCASLSAIAEEGAGDFKDSYYWCIHMSAAFHRGSSWMRMLVLFLSQLLYLILYFTLSFFFACTSFLFILQVLLEFWCQF